MEELSAVGTVERQYTYGLQRISENQPINNTWTASFYGYDGGGSVRNLTNSNGAVTDTYEYEAFGGEFTTSGTTPNNYLYRGEQYDQDLGLYYLRARYYNPLTGRFMSRDPLGGRLLDPTSLHKYLYAGGDPLDMVDPAGKADLASYELRLKQFLKKAPTLFALGKDLAYCIIAVAKGVHTFATTPDLPVSATLGIEAGILGTCGKYFFNTFRYLNATLP